MRNFAILTVGFALAMLGPGGPSVAWGDDVTVTKFDSPCGSAGRPSPDSIDIRRVEIESTGGMTKELVVALFMCDDPGDQEKMQVYFDVDAGTPVFIDQESCEDKDRTFDASGKVQFRIRKTGTEFKSSGPAELTPPDPTTGFETAADVDADGNPVTLTILEFTIPYSSLKNGALKLKTGDPVLIWVATQSKKKGDKGKDFVPNVSVGGDDICTGPADISEVVQVVLE